MGKNGGDCGGGGSSGEMGVDEMELGDEVITEYEKERLRTIEHNKAVFAALGLSELASSVADLVKDGKQVKRRQKQVAEAGGEPKRRSQRLKEKIPTRHNSIRPHFFFLFFSLIWMSNIAERFFFVFPEKRLQKLNWVLITIEFSQCFSKFSQSFFKILNPKLNCVLVSLHHLVFLYFYSNAAMDSSSTEQSESDFSSGSPRRLKGKQKDKEYEPTDDDETESDSDESLHNSDSKVRHF